MRHRFVHSLLLPLAVVNFTFAVSTAKLLGGETKSKPKTMVERERGPGLWAKWKARRVLGTRHYAPSEKEAPFFERLAEEERITGDTFHDYSITGKVGEYIAWFGIVRGIVESDKDGATELLVEMKYFDGLTDLHIMVVSFNGGGDFKAVLSGTKHGIKALSLVKVYGEVKKEVEAVPYVEASYVREWDWGAFAFILGYGNQKGNTAWQKLSTIPLEDIYHPRPNRSYYENRLGKRPEASEKE